MIVDAYLPQTLSQVCADAPATFSVLDPKRPDLRVIARKSEIRIRLFMAEIGGIEIQSYAMFPRPLRPGCKMGRLNRITLHKATEIIQIDCMERHLLPAGNQGQRLFQTFIKFVLVLRLAGISSSGLYPAGQPFIRIFKSAQIIDLPTMHAHRDPIQLFHCQVSIHTDLGIHFSGNLISTVDPLHPSSHFNHHSAAHRRPAN